MAKTNPWISLVKAKSAHCKGKKTKAELNKAKTAYVHAAVDRAKKEGTSTATAKKTATASANKLLRKACSVGVTGTRKKTTVKRKPAARKRKAA